MFQGNHFEPNQLLYFMSNLYFEQVQINRFYLPNRYCYLIDT